MPEHREGTPVDLRDLESFLWSDFGTLAAWQAWLEQRGPGGSEAGASFAEAGDVQHALRELETVNNGLAGLAEATRATDWLNGAIQRHALTPRITAEGVRMAARPDDPIGGILEDVVRAMTTGTWPRFKLCRDETCRASFYDASRNGTKTWCSMQLCGSRSKMRRLRARS